MRHLDQDPKNTLSQDIQPGRRQAQTSWMATGRERGRDALWGNSDASREGPAQLPVSKERPEPRVSAQGREGLWRSTQSSGQQRQGTIYSEREEEGLRWRDGIGGSPNGSEMGSKPSLIKEQRGWIEKLVSWELGGRMVRKKKEKDLLRVRWEERSLRKEKERVRSHSRRSSEKRKRRQQEQRRGRVWKELRHQAEEENLSKIFAWDRMRQKECRNAGERGHQVSWQQSKDPPTVFVAVCENSNCQSPQMTIPTLSGPGNTQNDTHVTLNPHSTWRCSASPCIGTGAGRLCG